MKDYDPLLDRLEVILARVEKLIPPGHEAIDCSALAYRWRKPGLLKPVPNPHLIRLDDLLNIDRQKQTLLQNTVQFVRCAPANNALLWGSRGTGKSSLIKAMLSEFADQGLRLIEVDKQDLIELPDLVAALYERQERYIIFTDDLSFEADDPSYKTLKAMLDGSVAKAPDNVLIYATSNRRHLMPEYMRENLEAHNVEGEIHHGEAVEEKISLSERFGLWLSFYPFKQEQYVRTVFHWLKRMGVNPDNRNGIKVEALRWALGRGSRSGRVAYQFALDYAGRTRLAQQD